MITVVIPVYNRFNLLDKTVESLNSQKCFDFDVIFIDDCSSLELDEYLKLRELDFEYKVYRNEKNQGVSFSRNRGAGLSNKDYLLFLDSDDVLEKEAIKVFLSIIKKEIDPDIIFGNLYIENRTERFKDCLNMNEGVVSKPYMWDLFLNGFSQLGAMLIRRNYFDYLSGFRNDLRYWQDRDFFYRVVLNGGVFYFVSTCLMIWKVGESFSNTTGAREELTIKKNEFRKTNKFWPSLLKDPVWPDYIDEFVNFFLSDGSLYIEGEVQHDDKNVGLCGHFHKDSFKEISLSPKEIFLRMCDESIIVTKGF